MKEQSQQKSRQQESQPRQAERGRAQTGTKAPAPEAMGGLQMLKEGASLRGLTPRQLRELSALIGNNALLDIAAGEGGEAVTRSRFPGAGEEGESVNLIRTTAPQLCQFRLSAEGSGLRANAAGILDRTSRGTAWPFGAPDFTDGQNLISGGDGSPGRA